MHTALSAGASPALLALAAIPLTQNPKPANALIGVLQVRCLALAHFLAHWIDGDDIHREPPCDAMRFSFARRRHLAFRYMVLDDEDASGMLQINDSAFNKEKAQ